MTDSGQKILIAKDGSWSIVKFDQKVDEQGNIVAENSTSLDAFQAPNSGKYPLTIDQRSTVENMLKAFLSDEAQLLVNTEFFKDNIESLKLKKKQAKDSKNKADEAKLSKQIKIVEASLKKNKESYKNSTKLINRANKLLNGKSKKRKEDIARLIQETEIPKTVESGMGGTLEENKPSKLDDKIIKSDNETINDSEVEKSSIEVSNSLDNQISYPKTFTVEKNRYPRVKKDCELVFDGYDETLRKKKKEVKSEFFFGYSQEKMKPYFKNDDFIKCNAHLSKVGKKYYITMEFRVKSKDAKRTYGMLRANETIRFEMVDGEKVYCTSMVKDGGTIEAYTGNTLYTGIFEIKKDDIGILKKSYLDNVGVIWSSGYEQYNIFNVDFLKNQFECLEK